MKRLWEWIKGEYKLWKLRKDDPYIYEEDEYDEDYLPAKWYVTKVFLKLLIYAI